MHPESSQCWAAHASTHARKRDRKNTERGSPGRQASWMQVYVPLLRFPNALRRVWIHYFYIRKTINQYAEATELTDVSLDPCRAWGCSPRWCPGRAPQHMLPISSPEGDRVGAVRCLSAEQPGHTVDTGDKHLCLGNCRPPWFMLLRVIRGSSVETSGTNTAVA